MGQDFRTPYHSRTGPVEVRGSVQDPHPVRPHGGQVRPAGQRGQQLRLAQGAFGRKPARQDQDDVGARRAYGVPRHRFRVLARRGEKCLTSGDGDLFGDPVPGGPQRAEPLGRHHPGTGAAGRQPGHALRTAAQFLLNLSFWPFSLDPDSSLAYLPGLPFTEQWHRYLAFDLATSLGWDTGRAVTNFLCVTLAGLAVLTTFRRAARRARFQAPVRFPRPPATDDNSGADPAG